MEISARRLANRLDTAAPHTSLTRVELVAAPHALQARLLLQLVEQLQIVICERATNKTNKTTPPNRQSAGQRRAVAAVPAALLAALLPPSAGSSRPQGAHPRARRRSGCSRSASGGRPGAAPGCGGRWGPPPVQRWWPWGVGWRGGAGGQGGMKGWEPGSDIRECRRPSGSARTARRIKETAARSSPLSATLQASPAMPRLVLGRAGGRAASALAPTAAAAPAALMTGWAARQVRLRGRAACAPRVAAERACRPPQRSPPLPRRHTPPPPRGSRPPAATRAAACCPAGTGPAACRPTASARTTCRAMQRCLKQSTGGSPTCTWCEGGREGGALPRERSS